MPDSPPAAAESATDPSAGTALGPMHVLVAYLVLALGFGLVGVASQQWNIVAGLWITEALAIALPAFIWVRASGASVTTFLGLRAPPAKWIGIAAVTAVLNQPVVSVLTWLAQSVLPRSMVESFESKNAGLDAFFAAHPISMVAAVAIAAPLGEEIFFRGFALPACARSMKPIYAAILTAALFSLMHVDAVGALGLFEIGFWLAVLRWGSGSLIPAILGHALNNFIAGSWFLLGLQTSGRDAPAWAHSLGLDNPEAPPPPWVLIVGTLLTIGGLVLAVRVFSTPRTAADARTTPAPIRHARAWPLWALWLASACAGAAMLAITRGGR